MIETNVRVQKMLVGVKELLSKRGAWAQGQRKIIKDNGQPAYCLLGAFDEVNKKSWVTITDIKTAQVLVQECIKGFTKKYDGIITFNDADGRKKKDVIAVLDCAIDKASK